MTTKDERGERGRRSERGQRNGRAGRRGYPYRFGPAFIARWEKRLSRTILIGLAAGVALVLVGLALGGSFDGSVPEDDPRWNLVWAVLIAGVAVGGLAVLGPLFLAFVLGGLAIHRFGWIPGLVTYLGMLAAATGGGLDEDVLGAWLDGWLTEAGVAALVVGVLGFFLVGHLARVPMTVAGVRVDRPHPGDRD
ncbi:hypothetical protein FH609_023775 [Streptomyces sp. 3MP-14]|uniref:Uncharacterized protein n=1 Tax=Streptomyces mimosae TaxID=2586635 RepID=A0A5N6AC31_9ACTN|nr:MULTISPECIES: hypothetical protein [Streptomyces]KAB8166377.1 hypothetical protein FH607_011135 [Streptomyces mimosae]KAB8174170.1 hypothetical protein FH609_023775 [Streptomyces sp. 3MP-14]